MAIGGYETQFLTLHFDEHTVQKKPCVVLCHGVGDDGERFAKGFGIAVTLTEAAVGTEVRKLIGG